MEALSESRQTFIRGRCSLQAELANIPFLKPEKCTTSGGASVYRPLQGGGTTPGFRRKRRKNYTLSLYGLSTHSWLANHTGKKKHTREESRFLFKFFDVHTTLVKTLGTLTQQLVKMTHFFSPPGSVLTLWIHIFFNTINIAEGRGTAETDSFNNISKHL